MKRGLALVAWLVACTPQDPPGSRAEGSAPTPTSQSAAPAASLPAVANAAPVPSTASSLGAFVAQKAKLVGHTSLVLKLEDPQRGKAVFRPAFRQGGARYRGEIAAYRLGLALSIGARFAEAIPHTLPKERVRSLLGEADRTRFDADAIVDDRGQVSGALVRWIDGLDVPAFEKEPWLGRWKAWLQTDAAPEPADARLASEFSTLVVFDYLTGNFDRWSGGNLGAVGQGPELSLRFIDNDGAFLEPMPKGPLAASKQRLVATRHFSRSFVARLRELLQQPTWDALFGLGADGAPLLPSTVVAGVRARAEEALSQVASITAQTGEAAALPFP